MHLSHSGPRDTVRGFTLAELLLTLLIVAVGLLGLGKLQAAALAESSVSRTRALMTFQAEALAAAMRANPGYWAATSSPLPGITVTASGVSDAAGTLSAYAGSGSPAWSCVGAGLNSSATCTPAQLAYDDVTTWQTHFDSAASGQFPGATATVACNTTAGPTSCDITLAWNEHYAAMNRSTASGVTSVLASNTSTLGNTIVLHVQP